MPDEQFVIVDIPGVGEVEFPATMGEADIDRAAAKLYHENTPLAKANATPLNEPTTFMGGAAKSLGNTLSGFWGGLKSSITDIPSDVMAMDRARQAYGTPAQQAEERTAAETDPYGLTAAKSTVTSLSDPRQGGKMVGNLATGLIAPHIPGAAMTVAGEVPAAIDAARGPVGRGVSATGRGVEAVGKALGPASVPAAVVEGLSRGSPYEAAAIVAGPPAIRATGRGLQRVGRAIEGDRILPQPPEPMPFQSTRPGGPAGGTRPAPPYRPVPDVPDSPNATGASEWYPERPTPEPILTPDSPNATLREGPTPDWAQPRPESAPVPDSPNARGGTRPAPEPRPPTPETPDSPNATGRTEWYHERPTPETPAAEAASPPANAPILRKGTPESRARATTTVNDALDQALQDNLGKTSSPAAETPPTPETSPSPLAQQMEDSVLIEQAKRTHRPPAKDHPIWKRVQAARDADGVDGAAREFGLPQKWVEQNTTAGGKLPTNRAAQLSERLEQMTREEALDYYQKANPAKPSPFSTHIKEWLESKGWQ